MYVRSLARLARTCFFSRPTLLQPMLQVKDSIRAMFLVAFPTDSRFFCTHPMPPAEGDGFRGWTTPCSPCVCKLHSTKQCRELEFTTNLLLRATSSSVKHAFGIKFMTYGVVCRNVRASECMRYMSLRYMQKSPYPVIPTTKL